MTSWSRRCINQLLRELGVPVSNGRPFALTPDQQADALARLRNGEHQGVIAADFGVHRVTVGRLQRRPESVPRVTSNTQHQTLDTTP